MSERYPGGIISKTPPTITGPTGGEGGSASGMWNLTDVLENEKAGTWPKKTLTRNMFVIGGSLEGALGLNDVISRSSPVQIGSSSDKYELGFAASDVQYLIKNTGQLYSMGSNAAGELGLNDRLVNRSSPTQIGSLTDWGTSSSSFGTGQGYCLAIKTDGSLWSWGNGGDGRTGHNDNNVARSSPVQVGSLTTWSQVYGNRLHSFALKTDGTIWAWGANTGGQLGQGNTTSYSSPVQVGSDTDWAFIGGNSQYNGYAVKTSGELYTWGFGLYGNNGLNNTNNYYTPQQVGSLTNWSKAVGTHSSVVAIKTDGTLWGWGRNLGEIGNNDAVSYSSPIQIGTDTDWSDLALLGYGQCWIAIKSDGSAYGCGFQTNDGNLGQEDQITYSSPVQIGAGTTWTKASVSRSNTTLLQKI